jgi:hypothetical protein
MMVKVGPHPKVLGGQDFADLNMLAQAGDVLFCVGDEPVSFLFLALMPVAIL